MMSLVEVGDVLGVVGMFGVPFGMYAECSSDAHVWGSLVLLLERYRGVYSAICDVAECTPRYVMSRSVLRDM